MRRIFRDGQAELLRGMRAVLAADAATAALLDGELPGMVVSGVRAKAWSSATFSGQRHVIELMLRGEAGAVERARVHLTRALPATEFVLRGHLVASVDVTDWQLVRQGDRLTCTLRVEALTVEE